MNWQSILFRLMAVFLLIAINAFFVTAEFAIVSVRRSRINHLVIEGNLTAKTVQSLQRSLDRLLSTTQLGITLSSLALGWIGEGAMAMSIHELISSLPLPEDTIQSLTHSISIPLAFILLVYLQIVLGELCPKSLALLYSEQLALILAPPSLVIERVFTPFVEILNQSTRLLLKLIGVKYTGQGWYKQVTPEELQLIIQTEKESSGLEAEERELLSNIFEFGDVEALEVMTPRVEIEAVDLTTTCQELLYQVAKTGHSCYPVIGDSMDDIRGIINCKDCICYLTQSQVDPDTTIKELIKPVRFLPESTLLSELLSIMQDNRLKMVIILDEYGGTAGLVTMQDLINEILGGYDNNELEEDNDFVKVLDEQNFLVSAQINLEELNDLLDFNLPLTDEYQTLAGFLVYQWQKIPQEGEIFHFDNLDFTVIDLEGQRINKIKITVRENSNILINKL